MFRQFQNPQEEQLAVDIIARIDQGEKWIFQGADGAADFGGFLDRLFYRDNGTYGTFAACLYGGILRIHIGFNTDLPGSLRGEVLSLILGARAKWNTRTSIWYPADNLQLGEFLFQGLPWDAKGHKTHELKFLAAGEDAALPAGITIVPFEAKHLLPLCRVLDGALAHTFDDPEAGIFLRNKENCLPDWLEKAKTDDCCVMLEGHEVLGGYILKGAEIDFIAVSKGRQGAGLGRCLLHHAKSHIFSVCSEVPYLYCIDKNPDALRFYLREGMKMTGYAGSVFLEPYEGDHNGQKP